MSQQESPKKQTVMQEPLCHSVVKIHVKGVFHERLTTYTLISKKIKAHFQASFNTAAVKYDFFSLSV